MYQKLSITILLLSISLISFSQIKIDVNDVSKHVGDSVTVCSVVVNTKVIQHFTYLDLEKAYPNNPLTVVLREEVYSKFPAPPDVLFRGKNVCITGKLHYYGKRIQILIDDPAQIQMKE